MKNKIKNKGYFIAFEGGEGSGKSTQARLLAQWLNRKGIKTVLTLNPGGTEIGEKIRTILLDPKNSILSAKAELLLYEADRAQHVEEIVRPALEDGKIVISDRFSDSSSVYQGICRNLGIKKVEELNKFATSEILPNLVIILDLNEEVGRNRIRKRLNDDILLSIAGRRVKLDRLENETVSFHKQVRNGFLKLAKTNPKKYIVFDGSLKPEILAKKIREIVFKKLKGYGF